MKTFFKSIRAIPVYSYLVLLVGSFVIGTTIPSRFADPAHSDLTDVPTNAFASGLSAMFAAIAGGVLLLIAAAVRVFAYGRIDRKYVKKRVFTIVAAVVEVLGVALLLSIVWVATEPLVDAGFAWIPYFFITIIVTGLSLGLFAVAVLLRRNTPDGMAEPPAALPLL